MITASIDIPPNLDAALRGLKPDVMVGAVRRGMDRGTQLVTDRIRRTRLTGQGPFAVADHRLGVKSGRLRKSLQWTKGVVSGLAVTTAIGAVVKYAAAHEFGFSGKVPVKAHQRTATKAFGVKLSEPKPHSVKAHQRTVRVPERRPIRSGIEESLDVFNREITREVVGAFGNA